MDVVLKVGERGEEEVGWTTSFTDPRCERPCLYGYQIHAEGVRLTPAKDRLDELVRSELARIRSDAARERWHRGQFFRYRLTSGLIAAGLSSYSAGLTAELLIAANAEPRLRDRVGQLRDGFDPNVLGPLLREAYLLRLACHPLLSAARVEQIVEELRRPGLGEVFPRCLKEVGDEGAFAGYVRSLVLHGLFVVHGRGEERRVLGHARLPVQFGARADDHLTVFEGATTATAPPGRSWPTCTRPSPAGGAANWPPARTPPRRRCWTTCSSKNPGTPSGGASTRSTRTRCGASAGS